MLSVALRILGLVVILGRPSDVVAISAAFGFFTILWVGYSAPGSDAVVHSHGLNGAIAVKSPDAVRDLLRFVVPRHPLADAGTQAPAKGLGGFRDGVAEQPDLVDRIVSSR